MPSQTVPVTVKSLVFSQDPRTALGKVRDDLKYRPHVRARSVAQPHGHGHAHTHGHGPGQHTHEQGHDHEQ
jgi:ethanolamine utilization protein EutA